MTERVAFQVGDWQVWPDRHAIINGEISKTLEPKVMELLLLLSDAGGAVVSRADIEEEIWGQIIVGEDTVARLVSKLRKALGDSAHSSQYIETISKKGYRFKQDLTALETEVANDASNTRPKPFWRKAGLVKLGLFVTALVLSAFFFGSDTRIKNVGNPELARADNLYMNFTYADNETAIKLYEKVLVRDVRNVRAQAGLANALVQRVIRWPNGRADSQNGTDSLTNALALGLHQTEFGQMTLERALVLAERSARLAPNNADTMKALGLTYAAQGRLETAKTTYEKAIGLDHMAWESMVNLGEIFLIEKNTEQSLFWFMRAYDTMDKSYATEPQKVGPWQSQLGLTIARLHSLNAQLGEAEIWYRRVLSISPLDKDASTGLANILRVNGDALQADIICRELKSRLSDVTEC